MKQIGYLLSLLMLMSCAEGRNEGPSQRISEYFDVAGLLEQQKGQLNSRQASLYKKVVYSGEAEADTVALTDEELEQELQMFNEIDINKPVLSGRYKQTVQEKAGFEVTRYQADKPEELRVNYLEVYRKAGAVQRIEALFSDRNLLYNSTRKISLTLNELQLPQSYQIEGIQKMIFRDKVEYSINGQFLY